MGDPSTYQDIVCMLEALGASSRVDILTLLRDKTLCVGAIARHLAISQSAVSQHLRILKNAGLVTDERKGYFIHYHINDQAFVKISAFAKEFTGKQQKRCQSSTCERG
jgi:ArsR family transcriptional regulator